MNCRLAYLLFQAIWLPWPGRLSWICLTSACCDSEPQFVWRYHIQTWRLLKKNPFIMTWLELCAELKTFCDSHPSLEDGGCCIMDRHLIQRYWLVMSSKIGTSLLSSYLVAMTRQIVLLAKWIPICKDTPDSDIVSFFKTKIINLMSFIMMWLDLCADLEKIHGCHPSLEDSGCCTVDRHLI